MNEHVQPKRLLMYLFTGAIAVLFALQWGPGARGCGAPAVTKNEVAATVNGTEIPAREFARRYQTQLSYLRQQGSPITADMARQFGMPGQVLNQLVQSELLAQAAARRGITASDEELLTLLQKNQDFQKDGQFDPARYREVLRDFYRRTDVEYEAELRKALAAEKLLGLVRAAATVSDDEVRAKFQTDGNKASATVVRFVPSMYADQVKAPTEAEVKAFLASNLKAVTDDYEGNKYLYQQSEQVHARHILLKVPGDATPEQKAEVRQKVENLRKDIVEGGKDFAQMAKDFSEDIGSKESGGDLGFNERVAWVPPFSEAAFALQPGEVSQPVETQFGLHLIKVEARKEPVTRQLDQVQDEIAKKLLLKERAQALAKAEAEKALAAAKAGKTLAQLYPPADPSKPEEAAGKPHAAETGEFNASADSLPQVGAAPELRQAIFAAEQPAVLDQVYSTSQGFVVAQVTMRTRPTDEQFTAQRDTLRTQARQAKEMELTDAFIKALEKSATVVKNEEAMAPYLEG